MASDSKLWEEAYKASKSMCTPQKPTISRSPTKQIEPMVLFSRLRNINHEIKILQERKKAVLKMMKDQHVKPLRPSYYTRNIFLYVLRLEDDCWYVGMSRDVNRRFKVHCKGKGASWTVMHPPIEIYKSSDTGLSDDHEAAILEDELTIQYAELYGIGKVRGGGYCQSKPHWPLHLYE